MFDIVCFVCLFLFVLFCLLKTKLLVFWGGFLGGLGFFWGCLLCVFWLVLLGLFFFVKRRKTMIYLTTHSK